MNFWNKVYNNNKHISLWPWSDVISLSNNFAKKKLNSKNKKILELGFGAGANIPFFLNKKISYYGIEGSKIITKKVKKNYKKIQKNLICGDFKEDIFLNHKFDIILDRASITHNPREDISKILSIVDKKLKKDGLFIGVDWYSKSCSDYKKNKKDDYIYFNKGKFKNLGGVFFSNKKDITRFFKNFSIIYLSEKKTVYYNLKKKTYSSWSIVAKKK